MSNSRNQQIGNQRSNNNSQARKVSIGSQIRLKDVHNKGSNKRYGNAEGRDLISPAQIHAETNRGLAVSGASKVISYRSMDTEGGVHNIQQRLRMHQNESV